MAFGAAKSPACYYIFGCVNRKLVTGSSGLLQLTPRAEACAAFGDGALRLLVTPESLAQAQLRCERCDHQGLALVVCQARALSRMVLKQPADTFGLALLRYGVLSSDLGEAGEPPAPGQWLYALAPAQVVTLQFLAPQAQWWHLGLSLNLLKLHGLAAEAVPAPELNISHACPELLAFMAKSCERFVALQAGAVDPLQVQQLDLLQHLLVVQFLALLQSVARRPLADEPLDRASSLVARSQSFFEQNYRESITLANVSAFCGVSPRTLQAAFSKVAKGSPMDELQALRLRHLKQQLQLGRSVREACEDVGLVYGGRVSAAYRKLFGELPRQTLSSSSSALVKERA
jgi:AraC-like DNA-binding protein